MSDTHNRIEPTFRQRGSYASKEPSTGGPMNKESLDSVLDAAFGAATKNKTQAAGPGALSEQAKRIDALVDLRAEIMAAQDELRALSNRQMPTSPAALVDLEIAAAKLDQKITILTQQYREALSAYVLADEEGK